MNPTEHRRVVVTGLGLVSGLGLTPDEVSASLRAGRSAIRVIPERIDLGFQSPLSGTLPDLSARTEISAAERAEMSEGMFYTALAAEFALTDSGADRGVFSGPRAGVILGNDSAAQTATAAFDILRREGRTSALDPASHYRSLNSSPAGMLARRFGVNRCNLTVSAACSSGAHAVGLASLYIRSGMADRMITGGCQELCWESMAAFDALKAFSTDTANPAAASRPFDRARAGLVPGGGAAVLMLEELEAARARGARIYGEIRAYAFGADGHHLTNPCSTGAAACIRLALDQAGIAPDEVDYINAHATSTVNGDLSEARAIGEVFGADGPRVSSTKSMTGHECWMAGASEIAYSLIMMRDGFAAPNVNFTDWSDDMPKIRIVREAEEADLRTVVSNSFGFGGTNACVVLGKI